MAASTSVSLASCHQFLRNSNPDHYACPTQESERARARVCVCGASGRDLWKCLRSREATTLATQAKLRQPDFLYLTSSLRHEPEAGLSAQAQSNAPSSHLLTMRALQSPGYLTQPSFTWFGLSAFARARVLGASLAPGAGVCSPGRNDRRAACCRNSPSLICARNLTLCKVANEAPSSQFTSYSSPVSLSQVLFTAHVIAISHITS